MKQQLAAMLGIDEREIRDFKVYADYANVILSDGRKVRVDEDTVETEVEDSLGEVEDSLGEVEDSLGEVEDSLGESIHPIGLVKPVPLPLIGLDDAIGIKSFDAPIETAVSNDLTAIVGIGKVTAGRLYKAGINTFQQLIDADVDELNSVIEAGVPTIKKWQKRAANR